MVCTFWYYIIARGKQRRKNKMYETVKVVNGYEIYRMKNTQKCYWIDITAWKKLNFKSQKAAAEWAAAH